MSNYDNNYKDMLTSIYNSKLKYFAWKHYGQKLGNELVSDTVTYFLEKYSTYKHNNYDQLTGNTILKIKNLLKDKIRKENATGIFGKISNPGDYLSLNEGDIISIKEIKNINEQLKKDNLKQIQFHNIISTVSLRDDEDKDTIDASKQANVSTIEDQEKHQNLLLAIKLLDKLKGKCGDLIKSKVLEELSYKEIQKKFNINSLGTVMSSLSRCWDELNKLKEKELQNA